MSLSENERELLTMLAEEAAEIVKACTKALRHGLDSHHPETFETNRAALKRELADLEAVRLLMHEEGVANLYNSTGAVRLTMTAKNRYRHHQPPGMASYQRLAGAAANKAGLPLSANPYEEGTPAARVWADGWSQGA